MFFGVSVDLLQIGHKVLGFFAEVEVEESGHFRGLDELLELARVSGQEAAIVDRLERHSINLGAFDRGGGLGSSAMRHLGGIESRKKEKNVDEVREDQGSICCQAELFSQKFPRMTPISLRMYTLEVDAAERLDVCTNSGNLRFLAYGVFCNLPIYINTLP